MRSQIEDFLDAYSIPEPNTGCYIWEGRVNHDGYGRTVDGEPAHKRAYQLAFGTTVKHMHIHHKCRLVCCVSPMHLEALTPSEHKFVHSGSDNNKATCKQGHNLHGHGREVSVYPKGTRVVCSICRAKSNREYRRHLRQPKYEAIGNIKELIKS